MSDYPTRAEEVEADDDGALPTEWVVQTLWLGGDDSTWTTHQGYLSKFEALRDAGERDYRGSGVRVRVLKVRRKVIR